MHEDGLTIGDGAGEPLDGQGQTQKTLGIMELIEARPEIPLGRVDVEIAPAAEELAHDRRKAELRREGGDDGGIDRGGHDPPRLRARACYGCGHG